VALPPVSPIISQHTITEGKYITFTCSAEVTGSKVNLINSTIEWFYNSVPLNVTSTCGEEIVCSLSVTLHNVGNNSTGVHACVLTVPCCNKTIKSKCHAKKVVTHYKSKAETVVKSYETPNYVMYIIYLVGLCITLGFLATIESTCLKVIKCWQSSCTTQDTLSNMAIISHSADSYLENSKSNCERHPCGGLNNRNTTTTDKNTQFGTLLSRYQAQSVPNDMCISTAETTV